MNYLHGIVFPDKKLSNWFDGKSDPWEIGVYIAEFVKGRPWYFYWNGFSWGLGKATPEQCLIHTNENGSNRPVRWRGLAEKPE